ncbi:hypothetical protein MMA231_04122 (plasmid) [Asticcacaulis sp. MM231]
MRSVARTSHAGQGTWLGDVALGQAGEVDWPFPDRTLRGSIASLERYDDVESIIVTFIVAAFAWIEDTLKLSPDGDCREGVEK